MAKTSTTTATSKGSNGAKSRTESQELQPTQDVVEYLKEYARTRPEAAAVWCFGIGFILGWKLKPW